METSTLLWQRMSAAADGPVFCRILEKFTVLDSSYHFIIIFFLNPMPGKQPQHSLLLFCLVCFPIPE